VEVFDGRREGRHGCNFEPHLEPVELRRSNVWAGLKRCPRCFDMEMSELRKGTGKGSAGVDESMCVHIRDLAVYE
jgi:hypothetical protein